MKIGSLLVYILICTNTYGQEQKAKIYPFKSAIIEYKYEASLSGTRIKYIDDYGFLQADYISKELNFNGNTEKEYETIILVGEKAYTINWQDSTIAIGRNSTYQYYLQHKDKSPQEVSEAILKKANGYKASSSKAYLKKECTVWKSGKSEMLTWQGLMITSKTNFISMVVEKAKKIKIDKKVPEKVFEIPQGLTYVSADVYQGFSGLALDFDSKEAIHTKSEDEHIEVSFTSEGLGATNNFVYYTATGEAVLIKGVNDFNKIDNRLIKSQQQVLSTQTALLPTASTLIFRINTGEYGKLQIAKLDKSEYALHYILFNDDGTVQRFAKDASTILTSEFNFTLKNNKLQITPIDKARCFVLGW